MADENKAEPEVKPADTAVDAKPVEVKMPVPRLGMDVFVRASHGHSIFPGKIVRVGTDKDATCTIVCFCDNRGGDAGCQREPNVKRGINNGCWWDSLDVLEARVAYERNPLLQQQSPTPTA